MRLRVACNNCKKATTIKEAYISTKGYIEMILSCGCKVFYKIERMKQFREETKDKK